MRLFLFEGDGDDNIVVIDVVRYGDVVVGRNCGDDDIIVLLMW